jgi:hypothetical protein
MGSDAQRRITEFFGFVLVQAFVAADVIHKTCHSGSSLGMPLGV